MHKKLNFLILYSESENNGNNASIYPVLFVPTYTRVSERYVTREGDIALRQLKILPSDVTIDYTVN